MLKLLQSIIIALLIITPITSAETEQNNSCKTSQKVQEQLSLMKQTKEELQPIPNKCPQGSVPRFALQPLLSFGTMTVDFVSFITGTKSIHADITSSQALHHDVKEYMKELNGFDILAHEAVKKCNLDVLQQIKNKKSLFYNITPIEKDMLGGYRALLRAKEEMIQGKQNYFFQPDEHHIGYYADNSPFACTEKEYKIDEINMAFQELKTNIQTMWTSIKTLKERVNKAKNASYQTEIRQKGLLPFSQAKKIILSRFKQIKDIFSSPQTKPSSDSSVHVTEQTISDITSQQKNLSQESLLSTLTTSQEITQRTARAEQRRNIFHSLYNSVQGTYNSALEESLATTLFILRGENKLCSLIEESADNLVTYCNRVVANKPSICDDTSKTYTCN